MFRGRNRARFFATTSDAADRACLLRVHERVFRRISHLQTLNGGLNGLRLILISAAHTFFSLPCRVRQAYTVIYMGDRLLNQGKPNSHLTPPAPT
jgi:hypothetical protein